VDVIKLKEVSKSYKDNKVLHNVNLSVNEGDILGVIGKSGSGKTTLLNLLTGFVEATKGDITYVNKFGKERDLNRNLHKVKRHLGYCPQHNSFYPQLTVEENLLHFGMLYGINKTILKENISQLLKFTKLSDHKNKLAKHLSGGMQKRLDISCSLVHKPKILILDEPTADLDPILQQEIIHLLQEVNGQGITIVIASHHLESIETLCNKVIIVNKGEVHSFGEIENVKKPYLRDYFTINLPGKEGKDKLIEKLRGFPIKKIVDKGHSIVVYPEHVESTIGKLLSFIREENLYLHDMHFGKPSLNEVFERIVKNE